MRVNPKKYVDPVGVGEEDNKDYGDCDIRW